MRFPLMQRFRIHIISAGTIGRIKLGITETQSTQYRTIGNTKTEKHGARNNVFGNSYIEEYSTDYREK